MFCYQFQTRQEIGTFAAALHVVILDISVKGSVDSKGLGSDPALNCAAMKLFWEVGWLSNSPRGIDRVENGGRGRGEWQWGHRDRSAFQCREDWEVDSSSLSGSAKKVCRSAIVSYLKKCREVRDMLFISFLITIHHLFYVILDKYTEVGGKLQGKTKPW